MPTEGAVRDPSAEPAPRLDGSEPVAARLRILRIIAAILVTVCVGIMAGQIVRHADQIRGIDWRFGWRTVAATLAVMLGQVAIANISFICLGCVGARPRRRDVIRLHLISQPLKYLPAGGLLNVAGQATALGNLPGVGLPRSATAVALMQAIVFAAGAAWYGLTLCLPSQGRWRLGMLLASVLPLSLILLSTLRVWPRNALTRLIGVEIPGEGAETRIAPGAISLITLGLLGLIAWGCFGSSLVLLCSEVTQLSFETATRLTGIMAAAWLVGFVGFVAPAGIGVRDVTMMLLLRPLLGEPLSVAVPIASRLVWILGDLVNLLVVGTLRLFGRR